METFYFDYISKFEDVILTVFVVVLSFFLLKVFSRMRLGRSGSLPGPIGLPFLGNLFQIGFMPHSSFETLRQKYGNVFQVQLGSQVMVIISGHQAIKEALFDQKNVFDGRPEMFTSQYLSSGQSLSFETNVNQWKVHRYLTDRALRQLTSSGKIFDKVVCREAKIFVKTMLKLNGAPIDPAMDLMWAVAHIKYTICFGDSRKVSQHEFEKIIQGILEVIRSSTFLNFFPWFRRLCPWKTRRFKRVCSDICALVRGKEQEHVDTHTPDITRDALDALITQRSNSAIEIDAHRLLHTSQDFMAAGLDITYIALTWCVLYLAEFGAEQAKIAAEIGEKLGCRVFR